MSTSAEDIKRLMRAGGTGTLADGWMTEAADLIDYLEGVVEQIFQMSMASEIGDEARLREIREIACDAMEQCELYDPAGGSVPQTKGVE